jgi:hypothetical protein
VVEPHAVLLAQADVSADDAEAARGVQRDARLVLGEDAGEQRPVAGRLRVRDERFE